MSLNVKNISYTRTVDLGSGNTETVNLYAEITEEDDPRTMTEDLKQIALDALQVGQQAQAVQSIPSVNN